MVQFLDDYYISDDVTVRRAQIIEVVVSHCAHVLWAKKPEKLRMAGEWAKNLRSAIAKRKDTLKAAKSMTPNNSVTSRVSEPVNGSRDAHEMDSATPPAKKGVNGLTVASADVILCREPPHRRSARRQNREKRGADGEKEPAPAEKVVDMGNSVPAPTAPGAESHLTTSAPSASSRTGHASDKNHASTAVPAGSADGEVGAVGQETKPLTSSTSPPPGNKDGGGDSDDRGDSPDPDSAFYLYRDGLAATMPDGDVVFVSSTGSPLRDLGRVLPDHATIPLRVKRLSGGITNELFHVYDEEDPESSVVVRVYGKETERVISRESELFYQSIFLDTYVHGQNFLIYQYLAGHETLPYTEMAKEAVSVAKAVAHFQVRATLAARHDRAPPLIVEEHPPQTPPSGTVDADGQRLPRFDRESNYTVHSLTTWVEQVSSAEILSKVHVDKRADFRQVAENLRAESALMLRILDKLRAHLGESVCHNDLLSANFMRNEKTGALTIIDFDYTKRDFFLFDAANHFNEYTGLECDYAQYFPSDEHMTNFVAHYRAAMREEIAAVHKTAAGTHEVIPNEWALFWGDGVATSAKGELSTVVNEEAETIVVERWTSLVKFLTLCSHLSWSIWSLVQEAVSQLDVDFLEYSKLRFNRYLETKEAYTTGLGFSV